MECNDFQVKYFNLAAINARDGFRSRLGRWFKMRLFVNLFAMKQSVLFGFLFFDMIITAAGQTSIYMLNKNVLSVTDFYNISFDSITLKSIIDTKGDPAKVDSLFGMNMEKNKSDDPGYYWINFGSSTISFTFDEMVTEPADLSKLDVVNKSVAIKIGTTIFHIGDPISKLGNVKVFTLDNGKRVIIFLPEQTDGIWLSVDFDQATELITKVEYMTI